MCHGFNNNHFSGFLHHFQMDKLAATSIRVKTKQYSKNYLIESCCFSCLNSTSTCMFQISLFFISYLQSFIACIPKIFEVEFLLLSSELLPP